jgi:hypothetical protein
VLFDIGHGIEMTEKKFAKTVNVLVYCKNFAWHSLVWITARYEPRSSGLLRS